MENRIPVHDRSGRGVPVDDFLDRAGGRLGDVRERLEDVGERVFQLVRARPGTSLLIALAAGYLVGRMLRA
jgi:hypothetical protein